MIQVFIVDDEKLVREALKLLIKEMGGISVVGEAENAEGGWRGIREKKPDVVLLDIHLADVSGLYLAQKLMHQCPHIKLIVISGLESDLFPARLLETGVHGYLTKAVSREELAQAIKTVYRGEKIISPKIASRLAVAKAVAGAASPFNALSNREMEVMLMMLRGIDIAVIAEKLFLSPKTVSSYRVQIFHKLNVKNDVELILLAVRHGLIDVLPLENAKKT